MYVRKFESDTLDDALKKIKGELGPDAIILKTKTNKGLKGAFKKKKIEITAAISEKNYVRKAKTDQAMNEEDKGKFYENNANHVADMIDDYNEDKTIDKKINVTNTNYGELGLNKNVKRTDIKIEEKLSEFLGKDVPQNDPTVPMVTQTSHHHQKKVETNVPLEQTNTHEKTYATYSNETQELNDKINDLQSDLLKLKENFINNENNKAEKLKRVRLKLKSLGIIESFIDEFMNEMLLYFSENDLENQGKINDKLIEKMNEYIKVGDSVIDIEKTNEEYPTITIVLSDGSCGQTNTCYKLASKNKKTHLINFSQEKSNNNKLPEKFLDIKSSTVKDLKDILYIIRQNENKYDHFVVNYNCLNNDIEEIKKIINGLNRSYEDVEVLICLSSIHSEEYSEKILTKYQSIGTGLIYTHLDLCMSFSQIFNLSYKYSELPIVYFGNGKTIPSDIEESTRERVLGGIFHW